jgi:hypothetical protein
MQFPNPPKLLPLGQDVQYMIAAKIQSMLAEIDEFEAWSDSLKRTDPALVL